MELEARRRPGLGHAGVHRQPGSSAALSPGPHSLHPCALALRPAQPSCPCSWRGHWGHSGEVSLHEVQTDKLVLLLRVYLKTVCLKEQRNKMTSLDPVLTSQPLPDWPLRVDQSCPQGPHAAWLLPPPQHHRTSPRLGSAGGAQPASLLVSVYTGYPLGKLGHLF